MKALTEMAKSVAEINKKIDEQYAKFVMYARAGKFIFILGAVLYGMPSL